MKTKAETKPKPKPKLLAMVCKRACQMRAPYRFPPFSISQTSQNNKNSSLNKEIKESVRPIVKNNQEKSEEKVGAYQWVLFNILLLPMNMK